MSQSSFWVWFEYFAWLASISQIWMVLCNWAFLMNLLWFIYFNLPRMIKHLWLLLWLESFWFDQFDNSFCIWPSVPIQSFYLPFVNQSFLTVNGICSFWQLTTIWGGGVNYHSLISETTGRMTMKFLLDVKYHREARNPKIFFDINYLICK